MLKRGVLALSVLFLISMFIFNVTQNANASVQNIKKQKMLIELQSSIPVDEIKTNLLKDNEVKLEGLCNVSIVEDRTYTGFYLLHPDMSLEDAIKDYEKQYSQSLSQGIEVLEQRIKLIEDPELKKSAEQVLEDTKKRQNKLMNGEKIKIKSLVVSGTEDEINRFKLKDNDIIKEIKSVGGASK